MSSVTTVQKVVVDLGTRAGGFRSPITLATGPSGSLGGPWVAAEGAVAFVAWEVKPGAELRLAVLRDGHVEVPDLSLRQNAVPVALAALHGGGAVIVWDQYGHGFPLLEVAHISSSGQLGSPVTIAHTNGQETAATAISINDRGDLVAAWVHGFGITYRRPGIPLAAGHARVIVSVCDAAQRCSTPHAVPLGNTRPACIAPAVAMTPNGTAVLVAAAQDAGHLGCSIPRGVWSAIKAPGHGLGAAQLITPAGDQPVAAPHGSGGAITVFNPGPIPQRTLAWSVLRTRGRSFAKPVPIPDPHTINTPVTAANQADRFVIAWTHASSNHNPRISLKAAVATGGHLARPHLLAPGSAPPQSFVTATDARGDAIVLWNDFGSTGAHGIHAAIYHR